MALGILSDLSLRLTDSPGLGPIRLLYRGGMLLAAIVLWLNA